MLFFWFSLALRSSQHMVEKQKVALIQGGLGAEKEVSLMSAHGVAKAFDNLGVSYTVLESDADLMQKLYRLKPDVAFLAVHGKYAEDGTLQGICEYLQIPYTGSGVLASALCMDKCFFKDYISQRGFPTPRYQNLDMSDKKPEEVEALIPFPLVVKPSREGSTLGISICKTREEFIPALKTALRYDIKILLEDYIAGKEVACSFLEGEMLTPVEIVPKKGFYDYNSKYQSKDTQYILPPGLTKDTIEQCNKILRQMIRTLPVGNYGRADLIIKNNSEPFIIEINTLPGLTEHSLLPKSAQYDGIDFNTLILKILKGAHLDYSFNKMSYDKKNF